MNTVELIHDYFTVEEQSAKHQLSPVFTSNIVFQTILRAALINQTKSHTSTMIELTTHITVMVPREIV